MKLHSAIAAAFLMSMSFGLASCANADQTDPSHAYAPGEDPNEKVDFGAYAPLTITDGDKTVFSGEVQMADDPIERARGLMFRKSMPENQGMLFDFQGRTTVHMWMKNTYIPLDMLFLNKKGRVVTIATDAQPLSLAVISSQVPVYVALELNAGVVKKYGIQRGDQVHHAFFGNAPQATMAAPAKDGHAGAKEN